MKLFEFGPTRSIRVRWTLQELGVPFESITVNMMAGEHRSPAFLKINPAGKLPALVDGDLTLTESVAIVMYLADKYPAKGLLPKSPKERAQLDQWMLFTATEIEQPLWRIARHSNIYPKDKRSPADIQLARGDFVPMAKVLEEHMRHREFLVGDHVTVGDFVLGYTLDWAKLVKLLDGFPRLDAYMERMYARPNAPMRIAEAFAKIRETAARPN
jgi:glutathione S-transferase